MRAAAAILACSFAWSTGSGCSCGEVTLLPAAPAIDFNALTPAVPNPRDGNGVARKRFGESPVYLDGEALAMLKHVELPPQVETRWTIGDDGSRSAQFRLVDYLAALGVNLSALREVHLYDGPRRITVLGRDHLDHLIERSDELLFSFSEQTLGEARMHWPADTGLVDPIETIRKIAIYVDREPPRWDPARRWLFDAGGTKVRGTPYAARELRGGVRIYKDGRLAYVAKRKLIYEEPQVPHRVVEGVPHFRLIDYLAERDVDIGKVAGLELIAQDEIAVRIAGANLAAQLDRIELSAPAKAQGQMGVHIDDVDSGRRRVMVTAISLLGPRGAGLRPRADEALQRTARK